MTLFATSCQSENADAGCAEILAWVSQASGLPIRFVDSARWEDRRCAVDAGDIDLTWMCGLWYVIRRDDRQQDFSTLVAPVMLGDQYGGLPVYRSYLVVRETALAHDLASLQGSVAAINEPDSHSGCVVLANALHKAGLDWQHFARVIVSGGHLTSLKMLQSGAVDVAAIDSTTFETELRNGRATIEGLRIMSMLDPSPIPPWTVSGRVSAENRQRLQSAFTRMAHDPDGADILAKHGYMRFQSVADMDYSPIRQMRSTASQLGHFPSN